MTKNSGILILGDNIIYTALAREALAISLHRIIESGGCRRAYVPAYICDSVLSVFVQSGFQLSFYHLRADLRTAYGLPERLGQGEVFVFAHYFGRRNVFVADWVEQVPGRSNAFIIEDCAQASFNENVGRVGDFVLYSPRKFWLSEVGACVCSRYFTSALCTARPVYWQEQQACPLLAKLRCDNWQVMTELFDKRPLRGIKPFEQISGIGEVPLGYPVLVRRGRNILGRYLYRHGFNCGVYWELSDPVLAAAVSDEEALLCRRLLLLPLDQTLAAADMRKMFALIEVWAGKLS